MSKKNLAYLAGIMDGEGNISLNFFNNKLMYPRMFITNTSVKLMDYLLKTTGTGKVKMHMEKNRLTSNRKPTYIWCLESMNGIRNFLILISPFLIIKQKLAKLSIEFIGIREKGVKKDKKTGRMLKYTPTKREFEIYEQMKILNKRGLILLN